MTVMIPFAEGERHLDWLALTDALAAGHDHPKAEVADVFLYEGDNTLLNSCLLYTSPSPRDLSTSRMPSSA